MKADIHPNYREAEIRCACGNVIKTRSVKPVIIVGICNQCHPFYTGQQKFVDTAGRVDKFSSAWRRRKPRRLPPPNRTAKRNASSKRLFHPPAVRSRAAGGFIFAQTVSSWT